MLQVVVLLQGPNSPAREDAEYSQPQAPVPREPVELPPVAEPAVELWLELRAAL